MSKLHLLSVFSLVVCGLGTANADSLEQDELHVVKPRGIAETAVHKPGRIPWCDGKYTGEVWEYRRVLRAIHSEEAEWIPDTSWERGIEHMCQFADDPLWQRQATYVVQAAMNGDPDKTQDEVVARIKRLIVASQNERANAGREPTDEERLAFEERHLVPVTADQGVDTANITGPVPWCAGITVKEKWSAGQIARTNSWYEAAVHLCQRPNDTTWKRKATLLVQTWMNETKQTQKEAIWSLQARLQQSFAAAKRELCGSNDKRAAAVQMLATCVELSRIDYSAERRGYKTELARLAWLLHVMPSDAAAYALVQRETNIDRAQLLRELADGPLAKNVAAEVIVAESFALLRWKKKTLDAELAKQPTLASSAKVALGEWEKLVVERKSDLDKVDELDTKLAQSTAAAAGCSNGFIRVVENMFRSYGTRDQEQLLQKIAADPLAALILSHAAICHAIDRLPDAGVLRELAHTARPIAGPRSYASYAVKARNPLSMNELLPKLEGVEFPGGLVDEKREDYITRRGVVGKVTKTSDGVRIEFKKVTVTEPGILCTDTNKVDRIDGNGNVIYRQHCRDTGKKVTHDLTPAPIVLHERFATSIKPGVFIVVGLGGTVPFVKAKADDKNLLAFYGYAL